MPTAFVGSPRHVLSVAKYDRIGQGGKGEARVILAAKDHMSGTNHARRSNVRVKRIHNQ